MKHRQYYYWGWNLILPLVFTLVLVQISMILSKLKSIKFLLTLLGRAAMVIMYLHLPAVYTVRHFIAITPIRFFVIGILCPLLFYEVIKMFPYGRYLALGEPLNEHKSGKKVFEEGTFST